MALTTSAITGRVPLPTDENLQFAELTFAISGLDTQGSDILPGGISKRVTLVNSDIPPGFELWQNTAGLRGTHYRVLARWTVKDRDGVREQYADLGIIQIGSSASYTLASLLNTAVPAAIGTFWSSISQEHYDAAIDAVALAQAWAESPTPPGGPGTKSAKTWADEMGASVPHTGDVTGTTVLTIAPRAVTASKVYPRDTNNLYPDFDMVDANFYSGDSFSLVKNTTSADLGSNWADFNPNASNQEATTGLFPVEGSTAYLAKAVTSRRSAGTVQSIVMLDLYTVDGSGTPVFSRAISVSSRTDTFSVSAQSVNIQTNADERRARFRFVRVGGGTDGGRAGGFKLQKRLVDALIVDGTITPAKLQNNEISEAEIDTGTASTNRSISARRLSYVIGKASNAISPSMYGSILLFQAATIDPTIAFVYILVDGEAVLYRRDALGEDILHPNGSNWARASVIGSDILAAVTDSLNAVLDGEGIATKTWVQTLTDPSLSNRRPSSNVGNVYSITSGGGYSGTIPTGFSIRFRPTATNTGNVTISLDGGSAYSAVTPTGAELPENYLLTGADMTAVFYGSSWIMHRTPQRVVNVNGTYYKFENGLLICTVDFDAGSIKATGAGTWESPYVTNPLTFPYPHSFISTPSVTLSYPLVSGSSVLSRIYVESGFFAGVSSISSLRIARLGGDTSDVSVLGTATIKGRWF